MLVKYVALPGSISRDREMVSREWAEFLHAAHDAGWRGNCNEGHRTLARQAFFWANYLRGGTLAARPSPFAPHIRTGRIDHAIDVTDSQALIDYGAKVGVPLRRTVRGEVWHLETTARALVSFANRHDAFPVLRKGVVNRRAVRELQVLLKAVGSRGFLVNGRYDLATRRAVRRWQGKHGMVANGIVTPHVWARLRKAAK